MIIHKTETFSNWMKNLKDAIAKAHINRRISRLSSGNPGDVKPVGSGVFEMRIFYGAGYRVYYTEKGGSAVILLCGGDKSSRQKDINKAKELAKEENENENN